MYRSLGATLYAAAVIIAITAFFILPQQDACQMPNGLPSLADCQ